MIKNIFNNYFEISSIRKMSTHEIEEELNQMRIAYREEYSSARTGYLVGSSLIGNKKGDSDRFWKLKNELTSRSND